MSKKQAKALLASDNFREVKLPGISARLQSIFQAVRQRGFIARGWILKGFYQDTFGPVAVLERQ